MALHFAIGIGPLAVYLLLVGWINIWKKPFVTTGGRDTAAMGIALVGLAMVGPMSLFHPSSAATYFHGGMVWLLLLCFYGLCVSLVILLMRPRLVVYNISRENFMSTFRRMVSQLDKDSRWAGESLMMPNYGVQLYVQNFALMKNLQLVANGASQSFEGWLLLERELVKELGDSKSTPTAHGFAMMAFSMLTIAFMSTWMVLDKSSVVTAFNDLLQ